MVETESDSNEMPRKSVKMVTKDIDNFVLQLRQFLLHIVLLTGSHCARSIHNFTENQNN